MSFLLDQTLFFLGLGGLSLFALRPRRPLVGFCGGGAWDSEDSGAAVLEGMPEGEEVAVAASIA